MSVPPVASVCPPNEYETFESQQLASDCMWSDPAKDDQVMVVYVAGVNRGEILGVAETITVASVFFATHDTVVKTCKIKRPPCPYGILLRKACSSNAVKLIHARLLLGVHPTWASRYLSRESCSFYAVRKSSPAFYWVLRSASWERPLLRTRLLPNLLGMATASACYSVHPFGEYWLPHDRQNKKESNTTNQYHSFYREQRTVPPLENTRCKVLELYTYREKQGCRCSTGGTKVSAMVAPQASSSRRATHRPL